ncbi:hydroxyacid dehydrogenase [Streptomyces sp. NPDC102259]|uniref:hydroxyacid dehydrogenase n=1 Tax=Streptomyces sp. NPDC102259 TaxID=3366148 RepID=UPI003820DBBA
MSPEHLNALFPPRLMNRLKGLLDIDESLIAQRFDQESLTPALAEAEVLITGWGAPVLDPAALAAAPRLRAVLHAAGTVRGMISESCWERGLLISSAAHANALPVAEFTLATILLAGKNAFGLRESLRTGHRLPPGPADLALVGNFGRKVGIIGASRVGRRVLELLRPFNLAVCLSDPYVDAAEAARLGVELVSLDELLAGSDIVSLHAPDTPQTYRMLDRRRLAAIPDGATLINTSRGALIDPEALADELTSGRLNAVLDVTEPEPLPQDSPLYDLPNVFVTPHIAGSLGNELERLGRAVVEEAERLVDGLPLVHQVLRADLHRIA